MFSPVKTAFFAFLSFSILALAIPTAELPAQDPKALILSTSTDLERILLPLTYVTSANATSDCIGPILDEVVQVVAECISALQALTLSGCACTANDIIELLASTLKIILGPLHIVSSSYSGLGALLGPLVNVTVELIDAVLTLTGGLGGELIALLVTNGCAALMLDLNLGALLLNTLGLGGLLQVGLTS